MSQTGGARMINTEIKSAYADYDKRDSISNAKVGCILASILMPAGSFTMDFFMYKDKDLLWPFFLLRMGSAVLTLIVLAALLSKIAEKYYRVLRMAWYWIPMIFIACLIYQAKDPFSPYYAGFNLVLVAVGVVLPWTYIEIFITSILTMAVYTGISVASGWGVDKHLANNLFFLGCTTTIVTTGSFLYSRLRYREFSARFELNRSRAALEENNITLDRQNKELADTIQKLTEAESQLVQSEKMASLGRMSAGIIHEINNPLNFATTGIFTLKKKSKHILPEQQEEYNEILKDVEDGITRVKNIVSDLRMFTHPNTDNLDQVEAGEVVASALRFLSNEMKDKATIEIKLAAQQSVRANKNKLIHVFVNLIQNSLDAMKEKPFPNGEKPTIWIEGQETKDASCLIVRDNGPGIASEHIDKIFDPFYTTKDVGEGMGLGLSICYRIMQECQGKISVRTEPGKFCEFTLEFPKRM
jgi:two-component system sensor histidine kinase PhcS